MTNEELELLLTDLCGRIMKRPKGILLNGMFDPEEVTIVGYSGRFVVVLRKGDYDEVPAEKVRLYLRPMSSMTDGEKNEFVQICPSIVDVNTIYGFDCNDFEQFSMVEDFLLSHHFDYRGLIPMNLAVEAKEGTYKTE